MRRSLLMDAQAVHMVPSATHLRAKFDAKMRQRGTTIRESDETLVPAVNHGRWVAGCPACGAGIALTPGDPEAFCFGYGCGHHFTAVAWPADDAVEEIERALRARPKLTTRNWQPRESVEALRRENRVNNLPERHETAQERALRERGGR